MEIMFAKRYDVLMKMEKYDKTESLGAFTTEQLETEVMLLVLDTGKEFVTME
jgi:hypothetical protein